MSIQARTRWGEGARPGPARLRRLLIAAVTLLPLAGTGCFAPARAGGAVSGAEPVPSSAAPAAEPVATGPWGDVQAVLAQGPAQRSREALEAFLQAHPGDAHAPRASVLLSRLRLEAGDLEGAGRLAEVMAAGPVEVRGEARLLGARVDLLQGRPADCSAKLAESQLQLEQPGLRQEALLLAGECHDRQGQRAAALKDFGLLFEQDPAPAMRAYLHERARRIALEELRAAEASSLRSRVPGALAEHYLGLRAGLEAVRREDAAGARGVLERIAPWFAREGEAHELGELEGGVARLERRGRPDTVAALLPLTGPSRRIGSTVLDALLVAARVQGPPGHGARLKVLDTRGDAARTGKLVEELAAAPEVLGVVGPFDGETVGSAAGRASSLGLPLIHVTVEGAVAAPGGPACRAFTSSSKEARGLAEHAYRTLGIRQVAILRPDHAYGQSLATLFRAAFEELGGHVTGEVVYPAKSVELKPVLDKLAALPRFEALFLPDSQEQVGLLASHLAARGWWSVSFGQNPPKIKGKTLVPVQLLGPSAWYDARLLPRAGSYLEGAVIASGFVLENPRDEVQQFVGSFEQATGRKPAALDAYARDAFHLLAAAIEGDRPVQRAELGEGLRRPATAGGNVTSLQGFDERGEPLGSPYLVKIVGETFQFLP